MRSNETTPEQLTEIPFGTGIITVVHPTNIPKDYKHIEKGWFKGVSTIRSANTHDRITTIMLNEKVNQFNHDGLLAFCQHRIKEGDSISFSENPNLNDKMPSLTEFRNAIEVYVSRVS